MPALRPRPRSLVRGLAAGAVGVMLALTGCAADDIASGGDASPAAGGGTGETVVVGGANFTEALVLQALYVGVLEDAGYTTETTTADSREIYFSELASGAIDVVPEYGATLAEFLNAQANGAEAAAATPLASTDVTETLDAARPLAQEQGVELLEPAEAVSGNGFAVTQAFAEENDLTTLSDLAALGRPLVIAATEECPGRPFCQGGLEEVYGLEFSSSLPTGFSSPATKTAVQSGEAQLALVGTTDATLEQFGLVVLEDDQSFQAADNVVAAVTADLVDDAALVDALNSVAGVLTTEDILELNRQVDAERLQPSEVATAYLVEQGLIDG